MIAASTRRQRYLSGLAFFCLVLVPLHAQEPFDKRALTRELQALLDGLSLQEPGGDPSEETPGFGASVRYLGPKGKPLAGKTIRLVSGYSNPSEDCPLCPLKIKPGQIFELGSTNKPVTAALFLRYMGQGVTLYGQPFRLDTTIAQLSPDLASDRINGSVTMEQLLNMTSGIASFDQDTDYQAKVWPELGLEKPDLTAGERARLTERIKELGEMIRNLPNPYNPITGEPFSKDSSLRFWTPNDVYNFVGEPEFPPGEGWSYSNTNYVICGEFSQGLVNFWNVVVGFREKLWDPYDIELLLGAYDFIPPPRMVFGWSSGGNNTAETSRIAFYSSYWTAGALIGTPAQLAKWGLVLWNPEIPLLEPAYYEKMLQFIDIPYDLYDLGDASVPGITANGYGLGTMRVVVDLDETETVTLFGHNGKTRGFNSVVLYLPDRKVSFSIVANSGGAYVGMRDVIELERDFTRVLMRYQMPAEIQGD